MLGTKVRQFVPIPGLSLDELVPADHFYRYLEQVLDLAFVRHLVQDTYAVTGRPSVDPVVFFKLQLVMFFEGIRSERHLMRLIADRLSVRWYLGYNLDEPLPDHSSLTRIRARYGLEIFRCFFDIVVEQCQRAGLVWGRELYFDSTEVQANASLASLTPRFAIEAREAKTKKAVEEHLDALFADGDSQLPLGSAAPPEAVGDRSQEPASGTNGSRAESDEGVGGVAPAVPYVPPNSLREPTLLPVTLAAVVREELTHSNAKRHDWIARAGAQDRRETGSWYRRIADFQVCTTDPDATTMHTKGPVDMGYHAHFVVDGGTARVITAVLVTPAEVMDNQPMLHLLWQTRFRRRLCPDQVTGDKKFGTEENVVAIEGQGIRAYIPLPDLDHRTAYFGVERFTYDAARDVYVCPAGKELRFDRAHSTERQRRYRARAAACNHCPFKAQCTTSTQGRSLCRSVEEECLERVRGYAPSKAYQKALRKRQVWVEPLFAEGKAWHGLRRFRLRRLWRVNSEALLIGAGLNLKRLLKQRGWGRRPFPSGAPVATQQPDSALVYLILLTTPVVTCKRQGDSAQVSRWARSAA